MKLTEDAKRIGTTRRRAEIDVVIAQEDERIVKGTIVAAKTIARRRM